MARYTGPKTKVARRFKEPIFGADKTLDRKSYRPGQHGQSKRRPKQSEYGTQLMEKQKAKYTYGLLERHFSNLFDKAARKGGVTGTVLLQLIESRLDNVVYRFGIAKTRDQARQLVSHRHILVNGELVNIPSYMLKPGDVVSVRERSKSLQIVTDSLEGTVNRYSWLDFDRSQMSGKFMNYPERSDIPENINEQLIVELYSK